MTELSGKSQRWCWNYWASPKAGWAEMLGSAQQLCLAPAPQRAPSPRLKGIRKSFSLAFSPLKPELIFKCMFMFFVLFVPTSCSQGHGCKHRGSCWNPHCPDLGKHFGLGGSESITPVLTPTLRGCCIFFSPFLWRAALGPWVRLTNVCNSVCASPCFINLQLVLSHFPVLGRDGRCS